MALGNRDRGDDGAALVVAGRLSPEAEVVMAGRPGADLLDHLALGGPCLVLDVTWSDAPSGTLHTIPLEDLRPGLLPDRSLSSHGFGPGEALALARVLGREIPRGYFVGIEGHRYDIGQRLSPEVEGRLDAFEERAREAIRELERGPGCGGGQQILGS